MCNAVSPPVCRAGIVARRGVLSNGEPWNTRLALVLALWISVLSHVFAESQLEAASPQGSRLLRIDRSHSSGTTEQRNMTEVHGVLERDAAIPCNVSEDPRDKSVGLILWYKDNSSTPIYTVDARSSKLAHARHFPGEDMAGRLQFDASQQPPVLRVDNLETGDAGQYRCRVDYRQARTENQVTSLYVIVPPQELIILDEYGQRIVDVLGPYNEGSYIFLVCEVEGGDPPPQVTWSKDGNVIDDTFTVTPQGFVRNELRLGPLRRPDLMAQLVCTASNNNATLPLSSRVSLDINLKPTEVKIAVPSQPAAAGDRVELRCLATGARPFAQVTWFKGGQRLTQVEDFVSTATNSTMSSVSFIVDAKDNGRNVTCRADNPNLPKSEVSDTVVLNVHYAPQLTLTTGNRRPLEGDNVTLVCAVNANPVASAVSWRHGGRVLDVRNDSLLLPRVGRRQAGSYECIASNVIGEGFSNKLHLSVLYAPVCVEGLTREYAASADIRVLVACEVNASPSDVHFEWVANTTLRTGRISSFTANGTKSYASTVTGTELEYGILLCFASNNVGKQIEPCTFRIVPPGPPGSPENCTVVNLSPDSVLLKCSAGSSGGLQPVFQAEVFSVHADLLHNNISSSRQPHFKLSGLHKDTSFVALVYAANAKGRSSPVTVRFATGLLNSFPSATDETAGQLLNPLLAFLIFALLLLACAVIFLSIAKHKRHRPQRKGSAEAGAVEKYSPQKAFQEYAPGENYQSPDLITTKFGVPDKPDIANTKQILQASVPRETALDPCFRSSSALEPYASIEKLPSPKNVCFESLDPRTAAPSMCTSLGDQGGYPPRCELQYVVAASETPLIRDLLHQGVRRKDSVPRCSLNTTPV